MSKAGVIEMSLLLAPLVPAPFRHGVEAAGLDRELEVCSACSQRGAVLWFWGVFVLIVSKLPREGEKLLRVC